MNEYAKELKMKTFEELKKERDETLKKANNALHAPDPFGTNNNIIYYYEYMREADEILRHMCVLKGIDPDEVM